MHNKHPLQPIIIHRNSDIESENLNNEGEWHIDRNGWPFETDVDNGIVDPDLKTLHKA